MRRYIGDTKQSGKRVCFVPTMGHLHAGHMALVERAKEWADCVVVSLFVNRMQFGPDEDFDSYPRTFADDVARLQEQAVDAVFAPSAAVLYPQGLERHTVVRVDSLDGRYCGKSRPAFFSGIATVVTKLFNIVQPDAAVFGEKDFQQLAIIRQLTCDLCFAVEIIAVPIVRESDGLAMSSRNSYLSCEERLKAPLLYQRLQAARESVLEGCLSFRDIEQEARLVLDREGFVPDYFTVARRDDLAPAKRGEGRLVILAAAELARTRLIDNIQIDLPEGVQ